MTLKLPSFYSLFFIPFPLFSHTNMCESLPWLVDSLLFYNYSIHIVPTRVQFSFDCRVVVTQNVLKANFFFSHTLYVIFSLSKK